MYLLAKIIAVLTRRDRYFPDFEWAQENWTHNTFRAFEYVFGRFVGRRNESSAWSYVDEDGVQHTGVTYHSYEAKITHFEQEVRKTISEWASIRVTVPMLQTTAGFPIPASPFLFAIAFDTSNKSSVNDTNLTQTLSYTVTGANPWIGSGAGINTLGDIITGLTYNSVSNTQLAKFGNSAGQWDYYFYLFNPSTGANNATLTRSLSTLDTWGFTIESFSGVASSALDSSNTATLAGGETTKTVTTTVVAANCWLAGYFGGNRAATAGAGTTIRQSATPAFWDGCSADSNGTVGTGSQSLVVTCAAEPGGSAGTGLFIVSLNPLGAAVATVVSRNLNLLGVGQ